MNNVLRIARLKIALQRAFLGRAILIFTFTNMSQINCFQLNSLLNLSGFAPVRWSVDGN